MYASRDNFAPVGCVVELFAATALLQSESREAILPNHGCDAPPNASLDNLCTYTDTCIDACGSMAFTALSNSSRQQGYLCLKEYEAKGKGKAFTDRRAQAESSAQVDGS